MGLQEELQADKLDFDEIRGLKDEIAKTFQLQEGVDAPKALKNLEKYLTFFERLVQKKVDIQSKTALYRYFYPELTETPASSGSLWKLHRWKFLAGLAIGTLALLVGGTAFALTFTGFLSPLGLAMNAGGIWLASMAAGLIGLTSTAALGATVSSITRRIYQTNTASPQISEPINNVLEKLAQLAQEIYSPKVKIDNKKVLPHDTYRDLFTHGFLMKLIPAMGGAIATIALMFDAATGILSFPAFSGGIAISVSSVFGLAAFGILTLSLGIWIGRKIYQKMVRDEQREWFAICKQKYKLSILEQLNTNYLRKLQKDYPQENLNHLSQASAAECKEQGKRITFSKSVRSGIIFIEVFGISISSIVWGLITICGALNFGLLTMTLTSATFIWPIIGLAVVAGIVAGAAYLYSSRQERIKKEAEGDLDQAIKDQGERYGIIDEMQRNLANRTLLALRARLIQASSSPVSSGDTLLGKPAPGGDGPMPVAAPSSSPTSAPPSIPSIQ